MAYLLSWNGYAICKLHETKNIWISEYFQFEKGGIFLSFENWAYVLSLKQEKNLKNYFLLNVNSNSL